MASLNEENAQQAIDNFLNTLRKLISQKSLNRSRLPGWVKAAKIRAEWINHNTLLAIFEDALERDSYDIRGSVGSDVVILLNTNNYVALSSVFRCRNAGGPIIFSGSYGDKERTIIKLIGEFPAFFNCGFEGRHVPYALFTLFLQHCPFGKDSIPAAASFVPFGIYIYRKDLFNNARITQFCERILDVLISTHDSNTGTFYEDLSTRFSSLALIKRSGVIILGKDSGPELQEMILARDYLCGKGYIAELIKEFPEFPMMSNEEKVRFWALASRFSVMMDRIPAGHILEYGALKSQRSILAFIQPIGSGSTYMIGDDVDCNFIKKFEFDKSPLEMLDSAIDWAEKIVSEREKAYNELYPWRRVNQ